MRTGPTGVRRDHPFKPQFEPRAHLAIPFVGPDVLAKSESIESPTTKIPQKITLCNQNHIPAGHLRLGERPALLKRGVPPTRVPLLSVQWTTGC